MTGNNVIDLGARRAEQIDGTANVACPKCNCQWWRSPGVVFDADTGGVTGWAYPLTCTECNHTIGPYRSPIGTPPKPVRPA